MPSTQYIEENEVTLPAILDLFLNSHHEAEIDREGRLIVLTEMALVGIDVLRHKNIKFIRFTSMYKMKDSASIEQKLEFANKMNNNIIMARFSVLEVDQQAMNVVYHLPFWGGVSANHILTAFRLFNHVYASAPGITDCDNLIEYGTHPELREPPPTGRTLN
jgi:hypothetical protein